MRLKLGKIKKSVTVTVLARSIRPRLASSRMSDSLQPTGRGRPARGSRVSLNRRNKGGQSSNNAVNSTVLSRFANLDISNSGTYPARSTKGPGKAASNQSTIQRARPTTSSFLLSLSLFLYLQQFPFNYL